MANPMSLMLFGPPLSTSRSFDSIFCYPTSLDTLHHLYTSYQQHCYGDVNACLSLQNAYLSHRLDLIEKKLDRVKGTTKNCDDGLFRSAKAENFFKKVDKEFEDGFHRVATEFQNHSLPIVSNDKIGQLITEAERIFGSTWSHLLAL